MMLRSRAIESILSPAAPITADVDVEEVVDELVVVVAMLDSASITAPMRDSSCVCDCDCG